MSKTSTIQKIKENVYENINNEITGQKLQDTLVEIVNDEYIEFSKKQDELVSGTNIKTINNNSLVGAGNVNITAGSLNVYTKGETDSLLNTKVAKTTTINGKSLSENVTLIPSDINAQPTLVSGTNIKTINGASLLGSGNMVIEPDWINEIYGGKTDRSKVKIGPGLSGTGENSITIGTNPYCGDNSIAIGNGIDSGTGGINNTINIGNNSKCSQSRGIAIGANSKSYGATSLSIGWAAESTMINSIAIGNTAKAQSDSSMAIGGVVNTGSTNSIALGLGSSVPINTPNILSIGSDTTLNRRIINVANGINNNDAVTFSQLDTKQNTLVSGTNIKTINGASILGSGDIVVGADFINEIYGGVAAKTSVAIGANSVTFGGISIGSKSDGSAGLAIAIGNTAKVNVANKFDGIAIGNSSTVSSQSAVGLGKLSKVDINSTGSIAIGNNAVVNSSATSSIALGENSVIPSGWGNTLSIGSDTLKRKIINVADGAALTDAVTLSQLNTKQNTLVSGTNIKTINGTSLLGNGDVLTGAGLSQITHEDSFAASDFSLLTAPGDDNPNVTLNSFKVYTIKTGRLVNVMITFITENTANGKTILSSNSGIKILRYPFVSEILNIVGTTTYGGERPIYPIFNKSGGILIRDINLNYFNEGTASFSGCISFSYMTN